MMDLRELIGAELRWVRTAYWPAAFALRWNEFDVGTVAWERVFSWRAIVRTAADAWRIRRRGLRTYTLEQAESGAPVGTLVLRLGPDEVQMVDGRRFELRRVSILPPASVFRDSLGSDVVTVRASFATLLRGGSCRLEPAAAEVPEAALLALVGIYILVGRARRRARR